MKANDEISSTIERVSEISTSIASAVEQQSAATREIGSNIEEAAVGTKDVNQGISAVNKATEVTDSMAGEVLKVSDQLVQQETYLENLRAELSEFLVEVRRVG